MAPERRPTLPQTIGRYKIVGRLGKGAMGVVYSARDEMMERPVAIKVMMADLEEDPETSARFYREARAAGQLAHRNVITIYDMGEEGVWALAAIARLESDFGRRMTPGELKTRGPLGIDAANWDSFAVDGLRDG